MGVPGGVDSDDSGRFVRRDSIFRRWVSNDAGAEFPAEPGRYHLYVSLGCPWANRTVTVRALKGLEEVVGLSVVDPIRDIKGWAFREGPGATGDPINGFEYLSEAYRRSDPDYDDRYGVPVLWDRATGQIVNNESSEIIVMLNGAFDEWAEHPELDLYPDHLRAEIDALVGSQHTLADWRAFPTLMRFDLVYHGLFRCNRRRLIDCDNLWPYLRDLYQTPRVAPTVNFDHFIRGYNLNLPQLNPAGIIPIGPELDFWEPPERENVGS